ncbi:MAG: hypothetical protein ACM3N0_07880 [Chloroflexota bacterium]
MPEETTNRNSSGKQTDDGCHLAEQRTHDDDRNCVRRARGAQSAPNL